MQPGQTGSRFRTTSWTLISRAQAEPADLEFLLAAYWSPVYAYLRRRGNARERAEDLTQAFLTDVVMGRKLLERATPERGRFRALLKTALVHFERDAYRSEFGRDGKRARMFVPRELEAIRAAEPCHEDEPGDAFDREWAATALNLAIGRVRIACEREGLEKPWRVFEERVLRPTQQNNEPTPIEELMSALHIESAQVVYSMLQTIKRKVKRELGEVIAETVDDAAEVDREIATLESFLRPGA